MTSINASLTQPADPPFSNKVFKALRDGCGCLDRLRHGVELVLIANISAGWRRLIGIGLLLWHGGHLPAGHVSHVLQSPWL